MTLTMSRFNQHANIILVGFMGTGKSTIARMLSRKLKRDWVDMDKQIEREERTTIEKIFAEHGEARFRGLESALSLRLSLQTDLIISTGGGIVLNESNLEALGATGIIVCLTARPKTVLERVQHNSNRPLLETGEDKLSIIQNLLAKRKPLYDQIKHQVTTDDREPEDVVQDILDLRGL